MIEKLNKEFQSKQVLHASELNVLTSKIDEIIEEALRGMKSEKVAAAALVEHEYLLNYLRNVIWGILNGQVLANSILTQSLKIKGADYCIVAESTPDDSPDFEGQIYVDRKGKKAYIAAGVDSISDWKAITTN